MKRSNKRKYGFTLLELIISMAIISIISASVYTGYIIMVKQTKSGQVKQEAALEGKKVIEALQGSNFRVPTSATLTIDNMEFKQEGVNLVFVRYLNDKYQNVTPDTAKYIEKIILTPTKVQNSNDGIRLGNNTNLQGSQIDISREDSKDYIEYSDKDNLIDIHEEIHLYSDNAKNKMELSIYLTPKNSTTDDVGVFDYKGKSLFDFEKGVNNNLIINFDNYKETDGTLPIDTEIEIYIYNKTTTSASVYVEKQDALAVGLELCKGEIKIYNNRLSDANADFGTLYDITVQINDKNEGTLFTGYYKKNLH